MKDIVERLKREARNLSIHCGCNEKSCSECTAKKLLWEAACEIEEMRNLEQARRKD